MQLLSLSLFITVKNKQLKIDRDLTLNSAILYTLLPYIDSILRWEIKSIIGDPQSFLSVSNMSPESICKFSFQVPVDHFTQLALTLYSIMWKICDSDIWHDESESKRQHQYWNKWVIVTRALILYTFTHSNYVNSFQVCLSWV